MSDAEREAFCAFLSHPLFWIVFLYFGLKIVFAPTDTDDVLRATNTNRREGDE